MDIETGALVQRWIIAFRETPILIDAELMHRVLNDHDARLAKAVRSPAGGLITKG